MAVVLFEPMTFNQRFQLGLPILALIRDEVAKYQAGTGIAAISSNRNSKAIGKKTDGNDAMTSFSFLFKE